LIKRLPTGKFIVADKNELSTKNKKYVDKNLDPHSSKGKVFYVERGVIMTTSYYGSDGFLPLQKLDESNCMYKKIKNYLKL